MWPNKIKQQTWCHDAIVDVDGRCSILSPCKSARESIVCWHFYQHTWSGACIGISQGQIFLHMVMAAGMLGFRETRLQEQEAKISASRVGHDNVDPFLRYIKRARLGPDSFVRWKVPPGRIIHVNTRRKSECVHGNKKLEKNLKRKCEKVELCDRSLLKKKHIRIA